MNGNVDYVLPQRDTKGKSDRVVGDRTAHLSNGTGRWPNLPDRRKNNVDGAQRRVMTSKSFNSSSLSSTSATLDIVNTKRRTNCAAVNNHRSNSLQNGADLEKTYTAEIKATQNLKMAGTIGEPSLKLRNGHATGAATNGWTVSNSLSSTSSSELSSPMSDMVKPVLCIPPPPPMDSTDSEGNLDNGHVDKDDAPPVPSRAHRGPSFQSQNVINRNDKTDVSEAVPLTEDTASIRQKYIEAALSRSRPQRPKNHIVNDAIPRMQEVNKKHTKHSSDYRKTASSSSVNARTSSSGLLQQRCRSVSPENGTPRHGSSLRKRNSSPATGDCWVASSTVVGDEDSLVGFTELDPDVIGKELRETQALIEKTNVIAALDCCDEDDVTLLQSIGCHESGIGCGEKQVVSSNVKLHFADVQTVSCEEVHDMVSIQHESDKNIAPVHNVFDKEAKTIVNDTQEVVGSLRGHKVIDAKPEKSAILVIMSEMPHVDDAEWTECTEIIATRNIEATKAVVATESVVATEMTVADCSVQCDMREEEGYAVSTDDLDCDAEVKFRPATPREQRRCTRSVRPMMPVIVEDVARASDLEDDVTESSSAASSLRKRISGDNDKTCSESSLEGHAKNDGEVVSESTPKSLLDMLHKKYYPSQYTGRDKMKSAESLCNHGSPDIMTSHHCSTRGSCYASGARSAENILNVVTPSNERKFNQRSSPVEPIVSMLSAPLVGLCDKNAGKQMSLQQPLSPQQQSTLPRARSMSPRQPSMSSREQSMPLRERSMSPKECRISPDMRRCHLCQEVSLISVLINSYFAFVASTTSIALVICQIFGHSLGKFKNDLNVVRILGGLLNSDCNLLPSS